MINAKGTPRAFAPAFADACALCLFPPGIARTPSAAPLPSAPAPEKSDPRSSEPPKSPTRARPSPQFQPISIPFRLFPSQFQPARPFIIRFRLLPFALSIRFQMPISIQHSIHSMQLLHLFGALAKSLLQKPPGLPFRLLLLPYSHRRDMSRMCCSFCSLLPTFCVPTKETNWDFYEQNHSSPPHTSAVTSSK